MLGVFTSILLCCSLCRFRSHLFLILIFTACQFYFFVFYFFGSSSVALSRHNTTVLIFPASTSYIPCIFFVLLQVQTLVSYRCVMKLCLPICVHVAVSLTICICPGLRASVHAMMLCACVVCLVFIFVCRLFTITSDACACACGLRAYHYLLAALLIIT